MGQRNQGGMEVWAETHEDWCRRGSGDSPDVAGTRATTFDHVSAQRGHQRQERRGGQARRNPKWPRRLEAVVRQWCATGKDWGLDDKMGKDAAA
ncbi:uncharacterized protein B0I36DRAFT_141521 [Microdochium trichocladiopsis]|uniref:Uncharacterized protein n=1 Tax=Microdochium trichocladiopsis TaxID=1682393 RepID=A0A9P9BNP7_9PEZI|nr:uncharacterized protein B0I36DRAFT_141521 [Microdochium trichocladiopsis]KAH7027654.1 hypothetical protein B0I36DRAFT_141521 [Microdochium trichocladiopsis]